MPLNLNSLLSQIIGARLGINTDELAATEDDRAVFAKAMSLLFEDSAAPVFGVGARWTKFLYENLSMELLKNICQPDGWKWLLVNLAKLVHPGTLLDLVLLVRTKPEVGLWLKNQFQLMREWYREDAEGGEKEAP